MGYPLVTVLIAMYNAEKYIAEAIHSILNQTYHNFEIVIVDDGSMDNSVRVVEGFKDERIYLFSQTNGGPASARRLGISHARGKYIAILDADDIALPDRLQKQFNYMEHDKNLSALGGEAIYVANDCKEIGRSHFYVNDEKKFAHQLAAKETGFIHSTFMYRREDVLLTGSYDTYYKQAEDLDLLLRLSERSNIGMLNDYLVKFRIQETSYSHLATRSADVQWWYGALASVNHYRRKEGLNELHMPGQEEQLELFQKSFLSSSYHKRRLARQQFRFGNLAIKKGDIYQACKKCLRAFSIDPMWWYGSQAQMLKKLINSMPLLNSREGER